MSLNLIQKIAILKLKKEVFIKNINLELDILLNEIENIKSIQNIDDVKQQTILLIQNVFKNDEEKEKLFESIKNKDSNEDFIKFKVAFDNLLNTNNENSLKE